MQEEITKIVVTVGQFFDIIDSAIDSSLHGALRSKIDLTDDTVTTIGIMLSKCYQNLTDVYYKKICERIKTFKDEKWISCQEFIKLSEITDQETIFRVIRNCPRYGSNDMFVKIVENFSINKDAKDKIIQTFKSKRLTPEQKLNVEFQSVTKQLEDAQAKIKEYEEKLEKANKRIEDLNSKIIPKTIAEIKEDIISKYEEIYLKSNKSIHILDNIFLKTDAKEFPNLHNKLKNIINEMNNPKDIQKEYLKKLVTWSQNPEQIKLITKSLMEITGDQQLFD
jgi:hypothetical protein